VLPARRQSGSGQALILLFQREGLVGSEVLALYLLTEEINS